MSKIRLSKTQAALLLAMQAGVEVYFVPNRGCGYFYRRDTRARVSRSAEKLLDTALACFPNPVQEGDRRRVIALTNAGKAWGEEDAPCR